MRKKESPMTNLETHAAPTVMNVGTGLEGLEFCIATSEEPYKPLGPEVFERLSTMIAEEPHLLPVKPGYLKLSYETGRSVIVLDVSNGMPVAHTRLSYLFAGEGGKEAWAELGGTVVHPDYRFRGVNKAMYAKLLPRHRELNIIATTTNPISFAVGFECHFVMIRRRDLPEFVWRASCCCPFVKTGAQDNSFCRLAHQEPQKDPRTDTCFFRVTPETAARLDLQPCMV